MAKRQTEEDENRNERINGEGLNSPDAVAKRAYEIYQNRGGTDGADLDDWLEAERQLKGPTDVTGPALAGAGEAATAEAFRRDGSLKR